MNNTSDRVKPQLTKSPLSQAAVMDLKGISNISEDGRKINSNKYKKLDCHLPLSKNHITNPQSENMPANFRSLFSDGIE